MKWFGIIWAQERPSVKGRPPAPGGEAAGCGGVRAHAGRAPASANTLCPGRLLYRLRRRNTSPWLRVAALTAHHHDISVTSRDAGGG